MADKHDPLKRVKVGESKGQGGASPGQLAPKVPKYKQLGLFGDQAKGPSTDVNDNKRRYDV